MKKAFKKSIAAVVVVSLILLPSLAFARQEAKGPAIEKGYEKLATSNIAKALGLTDEQQEQLKEQRYQAKYKKMETRNKIRLEELKLQHELDKKDVDEKALREIVDELKKLQGDMIEQRVDSVLQIKQILTPEQFEKLQTLGKSKKQRGFKGRIKGSPRMGQKSKR